MSGLTGLIDALLAARLAPRLDVLGIKGEAAIGAPGPVIGIEGVSNDVRLPSNAALDREIPVATPAAPQLSGGALASSGIQLSIAARVIGAVLADLGADPGPVQGAAPVWPTREAASSAALANTLAQTVSDSGLFYESHLLAFATGSRTLAQLSQEPQARWSPPAAAQSQIPRGASVAEVAQAVQTGQVQVGPTGTFAPVALKEVLPVLAMQNAAPLQAESALDEPASPPLSPPPGAHRAGAGADAADKAASAPSPQVGTPAAGSDPRVDAARLNAVYHATDAASSKSAADSLPVHRADEARHVGAVAASSAQPAAAAADVIHPQAVALVHQQLDLLATSQFRWSGQAWPGVPMDWSIEEEREDRGHGGAPDEDTPRRWSTTVSLSLPRLGNVDLRLNLTGPVVQAHLSASEASTVARLRADGGALSHRLEAAGLRLQELQVSARAAT